MSSSLRDLVFLKYYCVLNALNQPKMILRHGTFVGASYSDHSFSAVSLLRVGMTWLFGFLLASLQRLRRLYLRYQLNYLQDIPLD